MAKLTIFHGDGLTGQYRIRKDTVTIGRIKDCDLEIASSSISRYHARVERRVSGYYLIDNNSTNGTLVNGSEITEIRLSEGDEIYMGDAILQFSYDEFEYEDTARETEEAVVEKAAQKPKTEAPPAQMPRRATTTTSLSTDELRKKLEKLKAKKKKDS